ncbi:hypothetical protein Syun_026338 [Stephania yunnanensis]
MEQLNTTRDASDYLWYSTEYHVPRSWLKPTGNLMVVFEEVGGNPHGISLVKRTVQSVCADIYEWQPTLMNYMMQSSGKVDRPLRPKAHLLCAPGQKISSIKFASFGTPQGACGSFSEGSCHAHKSYDVFEKLNTGNSDADLHRTAGMHSRCYSRGFRRRSMSESHEEAIS